MMPLTHERISAAEEPRAYLLASHTELRLFAASALDLASPEAMEVESVERIAASLARHACLTLPIHERDEEESLVPRLLASCQRERVSSVIASLAPQHRLIREIVKELLPQWIVISNVPKERGSFALLAPSRRLAAVLDVHLSLEEVILFPFIDDLSSSDRAEMLREMHQRSKTSC